MIRPKDFFLALQFLTVIPFKTKLKYNEDSFSNSAVFFPLVGLLIGSVLALFNILLSGFLPDFTVNVILVFLLVLITGGLHMDGFADTIDAFYLKRSKEDTLRIMRDSHTGVMGVLGIVFIILLKIGFLETFSTSEKLKPLLITPVLSRWSMVLSMFFFSYARDGGKAKAFFTGMNGRKLFLATLITFAVTYFILGIAGFMLIALIAASALGFGLTVRKRIGGITGDTLGAVNEISEVLALIFLCACYKLLL
ncbi:adenosylcobinamide-GDP ribazoletransferase [bacterium]|nr:adenosylcobinamide-GDP ribazoletransferase [bacterium]MBU3955123.1 adenosylcobinamide-GDP ribazoletransferase [bacterium]MBU4134572.1 adenosylcobinamide-GDP ribazoletransferase [bacterium]